MPDQFYEGIIYFGRHPIVLLYLYLYLLAAFGSGMMIYRGLFHDLPRLAEELARELVVVVSAGIARLRGTK